MQTQKVVTDNIRNNQPELRTAALDRGSIRVEHTTIGVTSQILNKLTVTAELLRRSVPGLQHA